MQTRQSANNNASAVKLTQVAGDYLAFSLLFFTLFHLDNVMKSPCKLEIPDVEVGEGLKVAYAGRQRTHPIVVEDERLQGDELAEFLWKLAQTVPRKI